MGVLDFLKPKPKWEIADLPPPPPPPAKGLDIELGDLIPPPAPDRRFPQAPLPEPFAPAPSAFREAQESSIPPVSAENQPTVMIPPAHEEAPIMEQHPLELPDLPELEEALVQEPTISSPRRTVSADAIKPMFISVEDYQEILNSINVIKDALRDTEESMNRLNELKNTQEKILEDWRGHLEDAERKITYVDQVIFRGE